MALQHTKLADIQTLPATAGSIYANPASTKTYIRGLVLHNTNTSTEAVELYNVPDSSSSVGTAAATNRFLKVNLAADETLFVDLVYPVILTDTNDAVFGKATTVSKVTVQLLGDKDA